MVHPVSVIVITLCIIAWLYIIYRKNLKTETSYVATDNILKEVIPKQNSWEQIFDKLNWSSASLKRLSLESNQSLYTNDC